MTVTLADLREARAKVAELTANNSRLQPVFDSLDRDYRAMLAKPTSTVVEITARRARDLRELA